LKQNGGVTIHVIRKKYKAVNDHVSEISLRNVQFDYVIENDGTIEDLVDKVKVTLEKIKHGNA
jgi:dephospho-CoA kinase